MLPIPWPEAAHLKLRSLQQESCFETSTAIESDKIDWRNKGAQEKKHPSLKTCEHNSEKKGGNSLP